MNEIEIKITPEGRLFARRLDGGSLTAEDKEHARCLANAMPGITVNDVLRIFGRRQDLKTGRSKSIDGRRGLAAVKLLTPEVVAEQLAVSRSTVLRLIADGSLPAVCLRRGQRKAVYRIREEVLQKWILSKERQGKKPQPPSSREPHESPIESDALALRSGAPEEIH